MVITLCVRPRVRARTNNIERIVLAVPGQDGCQREGQHILIIFSCSILFLWGFRQSMLVPFPLLVPFSGPIYTKSFDWVIDIVFAAASCSGSK